MTQPPKENDQPLSLVLNNLISLKMSVYPYNQCFHLSCCSKVLNAHEPANSMQIITGCKTAQGFVLEFLLNLR